MQITIHPEYIFQIGNFKISNSFFTSLLVTAILLLIAFVAYLKRNSAHQNLLIRGFKIIAFELLKLTDSITKDRELSKKVFPLIATFFLFIVTANLLGLIPGFLGSFFVKTSQGNIPLLRSPNSDLNTTLALAIISVISIQYFSIRALGIKGYIKRFINLANPIKLVMGVFEMISEGIKILSFSFRLFGNVFAGEILLLVIAFLVPYILPIPFMILEIFVGIIQAFIFTILTLTFIKTSTMKNIK